MHKYVIFNNQKPFPISEREYWSSKPGASSVGQWGLLSDADFYDEQDESRRPAGGAWMQVDQARDFIIDDTVFCSISICEDEATVVVYKFDRILFLCVCCLEAFELGQAHHDKDLVEVYSLEDDELPGFVYEEMGPKDESQPSS